MVWEGEPLSKTAKRAKRLKILSLKNFRKKIYYSKSKTTNTIIHSVGVVIRPYCIMPRRLGLFGRRRLTRNCSPIMRRLIGCRNILKKADLADGCEREETGRCPVSVIGGRRCQFGPVRSAITRPLLVRLKNWKNYHSVQKILIM